jgi:SAM-dependent methyltransferase
LPRRWLDIGDLDPREYSESVIADQRYPYKSGRFGSHAAIERLMGPGSGRTALDVGCGGGFVAESLSQHGWVVDGIETDPELAEQATRRCRSVFRVDASHLAEHGLGVYDAIVLGDVLEHISDPVGVLGSAKELLRPDGFIVISIPNVAHVFVRLSLLSGRFNYQDRGILDRTHLRFFTRRTFRDLIEQSGYRVLAEVATPAPIEEVVTAAADGGNAYFLQPIGAGMARSMPTLFGYQFVAKIVPR